jgi:crotonobetainyl-CoA:carnitine CoA-transferase CaiB-like acyl-CoA transferase
LIGEPAWLEDPRFAADQLRGDNGVLLSQRMAQWCATRSTAEALDALARANIPAGPVLSPRQALEHEQVRGMGIFAPTEVAGLDQPAPLTLPPIALAATPADIRRPPPGIGEHTDEILAELAFSEAERARFRADQVV